MGIFIAWLVLTAGFLVATYALPGFKVQGGFGGAFVVAAVFGLLNYLIGWVLFGMIGIMTLGLGFLLAFLTVWLVNILLLKFVDALSDTLTIDGWSTAALGALIISATARVAAWLLPSLISS